MCHMTIGNKKISHLSINLILLIAIVVLFPFSMRGCNAAILLSTLHWLIWLLQKPQDFKFKKSIFLLMSPFLMIAISVLYSHDKISGWLEVERSMGLFFFPLIFGSMAAIEKRKFFLILKCATAALLLSLSYCLIVAFLSSNEDSTKYFWSSLSAPLDFHPTYLSLYINFISWWIALDLINKWQTILSIGKIGRIASLIILSGFVFLLASKIQIILWFAIPIYIIYHIYKAYKYALIGVIIFIGIGACFISKLEVNKSYTVERFFHINSLSYQLTDSYDKFNEMTMRFALAECSWQIIKNHPILGVGAGDNSEELYKVYEKSQFEPGLIGHLSPHNQYLDQAVSTGLIGLTLLIATLYLHLRRARQKKSFLYVILLSLFIINFFLECMLGLQKGVVMYGFFTSLFFYHWPIQKVLTASVDE